MNTVKRTYHTPQKVNQKLYVYKEQQSKRLSSRVTTGSSFSVGWIFCDMLIGFLRKSLRGKFFHPECVTHSKVIRDNYFARTIPFSIKRAGSNDTKILSFRYPYAFFFREPHDFLGKSFAVPASDTQNALFLHALQCQML